MVAGAAVTVKRRFIRPTLTLLFTSPLVLPTGPCATAGVIFGGRRLQCVHLQCIGVHGNRSDLRQAHWCACAVFLISRPVLFSDSTSKIRMPSRDSVPGTSTAESESSLKLTMAACTEGAVSERGQFGRRRSRYSETAVYPPHPHPIFHISFSTAYWTLCNG